MLKEWVAFFQTLLWISLILVLVFIFRKEISELFSEIIKRLKFGARLKVGPVDLGPAYSSEEPGSDCHNDVDEEWQKWVNVQKKVRRINEAAATIRTFQRIVLDRGCINFEYILNLKDFGHLLTIVKREYEHSQSSDMTYICKDFNTSLKIGEETSQMSWTARKLKGAGDSWEIIAFKL